MSYKSAYTRIVTLSLFGLSTAAHALPMVITNVNGGQFTASRAPASFARVAAVALDAGSAPIITQQPADQTVTAGTPVTFSVSATGSAPLTYQWYKNGTVAAGATLTTYTIPAPSAADNGDQVYVVVTDVNCDMTPSQIAILEVSGGTPPCDVNKDGVTNVADVQLEVDAALGEVVCTATYDINKDGLCNVIDVQRVVNAALGEACVSP